MTSEERAVLIGAALAAFAFAYFKAYLLLALMLAAIAGTLFRVWRRRHR